jgi:hypothetical protein
MIDLKILNGARIWRTMGLASFLPLNRFLTDFVAKKEGSSLRGLIFSLI